MPSINSPLGRLQAAQQNPQKRVLTVPNEEDNLENNVISNQEDNNNFMPNEEIQHDDYLNQRKTIVNKKPQFSAIAKERIEFLTGLGRCKEVIDFEGTNFSIRSLNDQETTDVALVLNKVTSKAEFVYEIRRQTLARAIYQIDGQPVYLVIGSADIEDFISVLKEMDDLCIDHLWNKYSYMVQSKKDKFSIKDNIDAKEVSAQIKK